MKTGSAAFPGFRPHRSPVNGTTIYALAGGTGPPVLLLHGYPQTHLMWRKVTPRLAGSFRSWITAATHQQ